MTTGQLQLIVSIATSGVVVWVLTTLYNRYQARTPSISKDLTITPVHVAPNGLPATVEAGISVPTPDGLTVLVDRLYQVRLVIENVSNKDFEQFRFGVSFPRNVLPLSPEKAAGRDRHHVVIMTKTPHIPDALYNAGGWSEFSIERESQLRDYVLTPFNKTDRYTFEFVFVPIMVTSGNTSDDAGGWNEWAKFEPTTGSLDLSNFLISTPEVGVKLREKTSTGTPNMPLRRLLSSLFLMASAVIMSSILSHYVLSWQLVLTDTLVILVGWAALFGLLTLLGSAPRRKAETQA